jgi:hypothetical protein
LRAALLGALLLSGAPTQAAEVEMVNASRPTRCAEKDNVYVKLVGADIAGFRLDIRHPAYLGAVGADSTAPDFAQCDMSHDPSFPFAPRDVTLYDDGRYRLLGHTYATNWRPEIVPFRVAGREERGLHLVQLFKIVDGVAIEIVVLYPSDGYWRAKPLPPPGRPETAYGSSFLFGPIEEGGRPLVALSEITFVPETLTFELRFARGGSGALKIAAIGADGLALDVTFDPVAGLDRPFAALRSMFVTPAQADVAEATWRAQPGTDPVTRPILDVARAWISDVRFGRATRSAHNLSAPDLEFRDFRRSTAP